MAYDVMDRMMTSSDPKGQVTQFAYGGTNGSTKGDNLVRLTDARNNATSFTFDLLHRKTSRIFADASHEDYGYDAVGNRISYRTTGGQTMTCTVDARNRDILCDWSDGTPDVSNTYDAANRLLSATSSVSALSYTYDAANQLLSETQDLATPVNLAAKTVSYGYDPDGNRQTITYPDGTVITAAFTARNQVSEIAADGPPPLATYSYDLNGNRITKTLENGTSTTATYDVASRLTGLEHKKNGVAFQRFDYTLDKVGNAEKRVETVGGATQSDFYKYDSTEQLTEVKYDFANGPDKVALYSYDPAGNRTELSVDGNKTPYTANQLNQYTAIDGLVAPVYDGNGNLTRVQRNLGEAPWNYQFDAQNRLIGGNNGTVTFTFAYDAHNRCVVRVIGGVTTTHVYSHWSVLEDRNVSDVQLAEYYHGAGMDEVLATITANGTQFHLHDGLGSVVALTDAAGNFTERYSYDVYGLPAFFNSAGTSMPASPSANRFLFTGREWFSILGLQDNRNRYYLPQLGRWLSRDPLSNAEMLPEGVNLYSYVSNSPMGNSDPTGLSLWGPPFMPPPAEKETDECCIDGKPGIKKLWYEVHYGGDLDKCRASEAASFAGAVAGTAAAVVTGNPWAGLGGAAIYGVIKCKQVVCVPKESQQSQ